MYLRYFECPAMWICATRSGGNAIDVSERVKAVILRGNVNIVHIEKNAAIGALDDFVQEFPFGHFGDVKFGIAADVFDGDGNFEEIAHFADFLRRDPRRFKRVGHGQQVVRVAAIDAAPAEMVREPRSFRALYQSLQAPQMLAIGALGRTEVHRDAVLHHFVLLENLIEDAQRASAINHEIFGDDFEPIHHRLARKNVMVVRERRPIPIP